MLKNSQFIAKNLLKTVNYKILNIWYKKKSLN